MNQHGWTFESLFRWAWQRDFGTTPEQSVQRFTDQVSGRSRSCDLSTSPMTTSLSEMLERFKEHIKKTCLERNIDARAVAGAIAWEYEENKLGRHSDWVQYHAHRLVGASVGNGIGWGSIHDDVAAQMDPMASPTRLQCMRLEAQSAIEMVARLMSEQATNYFELTDGIWIRDTPAVLALFFNSSPDTLTRSAATRKPQAAASTDGTITLSVAENPMGRWVQRHLSRFEDFRTLPIPPRGRPIVRVRVQS
ncbi:hypothetical protein [Chondromyces crocatus]|uniref:Uncharacterized protein n=1 Tax=Chondromyces crocatus TaxID=52 RepID=A0A0K1EB41_CHOCO|nr:hypothetical protein [Chondromyces crocatus]AKT37912.1 uncharacterized protein CMC5_020550 [Chondromyces crocatus]